MRAVVEEVAAELDLGFVERDVRDDPEIERRYLFEIPVLMLDGQEIARHRITPTELRARLGRR